MTRSWRTPVKTLSKLIDVWFAGIVRCFIWTRDKWCLIFCNWRSFMGVFSAMLVSCLVWMIRFALRMTSLKLCSAAFLAGAADLHTKLFGDGINFILRETFGGIRRFWWITSAWGRPMSSTRVLFAKFTARAFSPALYPPTAMTFTCTVVSLV